VLQIARVTETPSEDEVKDEESEDDQGGSKFKLKSLGDLLEPYSMKQIFLMGIAIYVVAYFVILIATNVMIFMTNLYNVEEMWFLFYDFRRWYLWEGRHIISGQIPFLHYVPVYPIIAEYYLALFTLFGQNPHVARIFQLILILGTLWVGLDIIKIIKLENPKAHFFLLIITTPFFIFTLYQINFDILVVFFMFIAIDFCLRHKYLITGVALGLGFLTKLFPIILTIPIIIMVTKNKELKNLLFFLVGCIGSIVAVALPFVIIVTISQGSGVIGVIMNFVTVLIAPLSFLDDKPLTIPFLFFQLIGINKTFLKLFQAFVAFGLVAVFVINQARKGRNLDLPLIFSAMVIFFLFQPYIMPWYLIWIIPVYQLIYKKRPEIEYGIHQSLVVLNYYVYGLTGYMMMKEVWMDIMPGSFLDYALLLPAGAIIPIFIAIFMVAYIQVLVLIFFATNRWKYQKILIPLNLGLMIASISLVPLAIMIY